MYTEVELEANNINQLWVGECNTWG